MINTTTLKNGIVVITDSRPYTDMVDVRVAVGAGSANDVIPGTAHFLEHLMFKGTNLYSEEGIQNEFAKIGSSFNAGTGTGQTTFYGNCLSRHYTRLTWLLFHLLRGAVITEDRVNEERKVILREIDMHRSNRRSVLYSEIRKQTMVPCGYSHYGTGTTTDVESITLSDILEFKLKHYRCDNMVVCVVGNVQHEQVVQQITAITSIAEHAHTTQDPLEIVWVKHHTSVYNDADDAFVVMSTPLGSMFDRDYAAGLLLRNLISHIPNNTLTKVLRTDRSLVYSVSACSWWFAQDGLLMISLQTEQTTVYDCVRGVYDAMMHLYHHIDRAAMDAALLYIETNVARAEQNISKICSSHIGSYFNYGRVVTEDEIMEMLRGLTVDDIKDNIKSLLSTEMDVSVSGRHFVIDRDKLTAVYEDVVEF